jgi:rare lipoprotein A
MGSVSRARWLESGFRFSGVIAVAASLAVAPIASAQAKTTPAHAAAGKAAPKKAVAPHVAKPKTAAQRKAAALAARKKEAARVAKIIRAAGPPPPVKKQYDGVASFYSDRQKLASGGRFNPSAMTAAHRSLPFGTKVQVLDKRSGKKVTVTINDRGPFKKGRVIDLSRAAAHALGMGKRGVSSVRVTVLPKKPAVYATAAPQKK